MIIILFTLVISFSLLREIDVDAFETRDAQDKIKVSSLWRDCLTV